MTEFKEGDLACLVLCRGFVDKHYAGRIVTIRSLDSNLTKYEVLVDNGDPTDPSPRTNGMTYGAWLPLKALASVDKGAGLVKAERMRSEAARLLKLADALSKVDHD